MAKFYAKAPNGDDAVLSISIQAFTQSLQQNGWCKLPNGLIIQWFEAGGTYQPSQYPLAYPTFVACLVASYAGDDRLSSNGAIVLGRGRDGQDKLISCWQYTHSEWYRHTLSIGW